MVFLEKKRSSNSLKKNGLFKSQKNFLLKLQNFNFLKSPLHWTSKEPPYSFQGQRGPLRPLPPPSSPPTPKAPATGRPVRSQGHVIAILGGKGGVGKSVFAANFAVALAQESKKGPLIFDADPQSSGDLALIFGVKQIKGFGEALVQGKVTDAQRLKAHVTPVNSGQGNSSPLYLLPFSLQQEKILSLSDENLDLAFKQIRQTFPITIVDCGSHIEGPLFKILDIATLILVVTNPEILVLNQTRKILEKLQSQLYPPDMTKIVINRLLPSSPYNPQFIESNLKRQVLCSLPEDSVTSLGALARGIPFYVMSPGSAPSKGIHHLSRVVIEKRLLEQLSQLQKPQRKETSKPSSPQQDSVSSSDSSDLPKDPR